MDAGLTAPRRAVLARLAEILVPGGLGMPSAAAADVAGTGADRVLAIEPRHGPPLAAFLDAAAGARDLGAIEAAARRDPAGFAALAVVVANAYFMAPAVRAAIGYPGQEARDSSADLGEDVRAMLARVTARGPIFRRC